ncbi:hypothetical protein BKA81DRAFT_104309 [Phyllosticta paracitricarpa]|uniref:Secreted protein n=1 Tax=Phyllosticta paracitricarpa TaxID=2016321 RepID=A0ABR1NAR7_9PEZI
MQVTKSQRLFFFLIFFFNFFFQFFLNFFFQPEAASTYALLFEPTERPYSHTHHSLSLSLTHSLAHQGNRFPTQSHRRATRISKSHPSVHTCVHGRIWFFRIFDDCDERTCAPRSPRRAGRTGHQGIRASSRLSTDDGSLSHEKNVILTSVAAADWLTFFAKCLHTHSHSRGGNGDATRLRACVVVDQHRRRRRRHFVCPACGLMVVVEALRCPSLLPDLSARFLPPSACAPCSQIDAV